ncbi:hypothetical protein [Aeromicrobium sp. UC242_57]|uniref:hypothetical protein n=1 Tax=Aeromicrobium sp. UC242_57 TaxID=3374624 RepID=UPI0037A03F24
MTSVVTSPTDHESAHIHEPRQPRRRTGRWIDEWDPEDPAQWEGGGRQVARRNLIWSIFGEHLGFSVWLMWSAAAGLLAKAGFAFTAQELFWLVAVPNLVGSLLRLPYTFAVPKFGGRNWGGVQCVDAARPDPAVRVVRAAPRHAVLGLHRHRSDRRSRRR